MTEKHIPNPITDAHVALLYGGWSEEKEISKDSALSCKEALIEAGFCCVDLLEVSKKSFVSKLETGSYDVAFIAMHGAYGEDGSVQGLLDFLRIPYTFSGVRGAAIASHKAYEKRFYNGAHLLTPRALVISSGQKVDPEFASVFFDGAPVFVKPCTNGSSYGVSKVTDYNEYIQAVEKARKNSKEVIVEEAIEGMEVTVPVIGYPAPFALPVVQINTGAEFYDNKVKYEPSELHHVIPADLSKETLKELQTCAVTAHQGLGLSAASRSDFIVTKEGEPYLLETNVIPGMTKTSLLPDSAAHAGISFPELCKHFVEWAFVRAAER